ncbi:MAG TPA: galactokinase family protein [Gemmatimonadales bacterium]|nr:galactokinase family protein [Gemmatimonadales bacterium]
MEVKHRQRRGIDSFAEAFGSVPRVTASAPECLALLGDQTGQNGGSVLACATEPRIRVTVAAADSVKVEVVAGSIHDFSARDSKDDGWRRRAANVLRELAALEGGPRALDRGGIRVVVSATGTSAVPGPAYDVALARALAALRGMTIPPRKIAGVGFRAGRNGQGDDRTPTAVVEHAVAALARPNAALLVESASTEVKRVPLPFKLLLVRCGAPRSELATQRAAECAAALSALQLELPELVWLASWPMAWLAKLKQVLAQPLRSRALHILGESARARFGAELLLSRQYKRFGALIYESHVSWRRLYEGSSGVADRVVSAAKRAGAAGARATGLEGDVLVFVRGPHAKVERAITAALRSVGATAAIAFVIPEEGVRLERSA